MFDLFTAFPEKKCFAFKSIDPVLGVSYDFFGVPADCYVTLDEMTKYVRCCKENVSAFRNDPPVRFVERVAFVNVGTANGYIGELHMKGLDPIALTLDHQMVERMRKVIADTQLPADEPVLALKHPKLGTFAITMDEVAGRIKRLTGEKRRHWLDLLTGQSFIDFNDYVVKSEDHELAKIVLDHCIEIGAQGVIEQVIK